MILADFRKNEKASLLDAAVLPSELFGSSVEMVIEEFGKAKVHFAAFRSGRSQSPSTVSQQQNNSQTSDQNHSEAGYNTLLSGIAHIYDSVDAAVKDISTENKTESSYCIYSKLALKTDQGAGSSDVTYAQVK
ncbi:Fc receptor 5 [Labeo rohita]|uniref:Fc receptor 5 n=1 Tax=Labeo rohita TaxID=84645 RepID=A0A498NAZ0_LABRO|nr:Fc receptor 5 [Labeo rohita]